MGEEPDHKGTRAALDKAQARTPGPRTSPVDGTQIQDPYNGLTPSEYDTKFGPHERRKYPGEHYEGDPDKDGFMGGKTEPASLPLGAVFDRLGEGTGQCVSLRGTPWEQRALPPELLNHAYRRYEVVKPLPDWVLAGKTAKAFGQRGGSTQFHTKGRNVDGLIAGGYLVEVS